jgi:hypothetical protein
VDVSILFVFAQEQQGLLAYLLNVYPSSKATQINPAPFAHLVDEVSDR